jgi:lipopolysaccharide/colanic/teichoic acid biosynthesis glycosyltransferase
MIVQSPQVESVIHFNVQYMRSKRMMDLVFSLLLLPFLLLVIAIIALLIRLDSPGPIFFRQKRIGQHGTEFNFLKFRSMYVNNDDTHHRTAIQRFMKGQAIDGNPGSAAPYKIKGDPRVTRVGRFIRKTSLDELPQFFNVLRGDMSLVGPRPPIPYEYEHYSSHDKLRLAGKPGLTGPWQVYGRSRVTFTEMVEMDITYLRQQSLLQDLKLILLTVPVMIYGRGGA